MSNPWLKFYPRDWRGDQALRAVSVAARGLWIEMLCVMHEASPYGHLILAGRAVSDDVLARVSGLGADECGRLLAELESAGVFSRTRKGVIYSRRMIKDHSRSEKGRKSVNRRWSQTHEIEREKTQPNRLSNRPPTTQKPEARSQKPERKQVSGGEPPHYAFCGKVIRLTQRHFDEWRRTYHTILDLRAELSARDEWLSTRGEEEQKKFFVSTKTFLNNRHQQNLATQKEADDDPMAVWMP